jgi:putative ABC transport system permease protein
MLESLWCDVRSAARAMRTHPITAAVAIATLAAGISVNTTVFAIAGAVLDPELPTASDRVVVAYARNDAAGIPRGYITGLEVASWSARPAFDALGAYELTAFNFVGPSGAGDREPERVTGARASAEVFKALGVVPSLGRLYTAAEERPGGERVALITHANWVRRFAASPSAVGSAIMLDGFSHTVVGVLPERFVLGGADVWVPLVIDASLAGSARRSLTVVGRVAPGASSEQVRGQLTRLSARAAERQPNAFQGWTVDVMPLRDWVVGQRRVTLRVLQIAVFVVLLIACSNIANVQLARAIARRREFAVRSALGASRSRLVRHLLTEGLLLSVIGAAVALLLAMAEMRAARAALPADIPSWVTFRLDVAALVFTVVLATGTALLFGLAAAVHGSRADPGGVLRDDGRLTGASPRTGRIRSSLLAGQLALAMTLFVIAVVLVRFSMTLAAADPGFDARSVVSARLTLPESTYPSLDKVHAVYRAIVERVSIMPQASGVTLTTALPALGGGHLTPVRVEGGSGPGRDSAVVVQSRSVANGYFDLLAVRRIAGAPFAAADVESGPVVAINEAMARRVFPSGDAIGHLLVVGSGDSSEARARIVGVVRDTSGIEDGPTAWAIYRPLGQAPSRSIVIVVRTRGDLAPVVRDLRRVVHELDSRLALYDVRSLSDAVRRQVWAPRALGFLLGVLAALALGLSMLGVYGVAAYATVQQRREIGVRLALGAPARGVVALFVKRSLQLSVIGTAVGALGALAASRVLSARLGVPTAGVMPLVASGLALALATVAASYIPSRRAARVDPALTLRGE